MLTGWSQHYFVIYCLFQLHTLSGEGTVSGSKPCPSSKFVHHTHSITIDQMMRDENELKIEYIIKNFPTVSLKPSNFSNEMVSKDAKFID